MTQFNLDEYKKNPKRKVVTRDGRSVKIINFDTFEVKKPYPVIGIVCGKNSALTWTSDGKHHIDGHLKEYDLFFADEQDELSEFEKELVNWFLGFNTTEELAIGNAKDAAPRLLELASKELEKDAVEFAKSYMEDVNPSFEKVQECEELWKWKMSCLRGINKAYKRGEQDALKDFPKWRRSNSFFNTGSKFELGKTSLRRFDGYEIPYSELEKLPKE